MGSTSDLSSDGWDSSSRHCPGVHGGSVNPVFAGGPGVPGDHALIAARASSLHFLVVLREKGVVLPRMILPFCKICVNNIPELEVNTYIKSKCYRARKNRTAFHSSQAPLALKTKSKQTDRQTNTPRSTRFALDQLTSRVETSAIT